MRRRENASGRRSSPGLEIPSLAGYVDFTAGVDRPMTPMVEVQAVYIGELARLAGDLGCGMVRVFTGFERPGVPFDKLWEMCVRGLKLASKKAAEFGVTIAVQNHHDIAVHHETLRWLLEEVDEPNCRAAFDAWAPALRGLKGEELKLERKARLNAVPMGTGISDIRDGSHTRCARC